MGIKQWLLGGWAHRGRTVWIYWYRLLLVDLRARYKYVIMGLLNGYGFAINSNVINDL